MTNDILARMDEAAARAVDIESHRRIFTTDGVAIAVRKAILAEIDAMGWALIPVKAPDGWGDNEANLYEGLIAAALKHTPKLEG